MQFSNTIGITEVIKSSAKPVYLLPALIIKEKERMREMCNDELNPLKIFVLSNL